MSKLAQLMSYSDPRAFVAVVMNEDPFARANAFELTDDFIVCEILRHGIFDTTTTLLSAKRAYEETFLDAPSEWRMEIYSHFINIIEQMGGERAGALTLFMLLDPDSTIVSRATIDYVSFATLVDADPMSRPRDVVTMVEKGFATNPAAVFGGLLCLGDPRVCRMIRPLMDRFDPAQARVILHCSSGLLYKCVVDFYLDWLETLVNRRDFDGEGMFGDVVGGLARQVDRNTLPDVLDGMRPFPVPRNRNIPWPDRRYIAWDDFRRSIAARLFQLEAAEAAPKVMPYLIRKFGLVPRTPNEETAAF
jgi:hypothetical protein